MMWMSPPARCDGHHKNALSVARGSGPFSAAPMSARIFANKYDDYGRIISEAKIKAE
jgi:hypothetical protein